MFGISEVSFTKERAQDVDYSENYIESPITFVTSVLPPELPVTLIRDPFENEVWLCLISTFIFIAIILKIMSKYHIRQRFHVGSAIFVLLRWLCNEGSPSTTRPQSVSLWYIYFFWLLSITLLLSSYQGCLLDLITQSDEGHGVDTIRQLSQAMIHRRCVVAIYKGTSFIHELQSSSNQDARSISNHLTLMFPDEWTDMLLNENVRNHIRLDI